MYSKTLIAATLALSTVSAAPVAAPNPQLLKDLSPDVANLLGNLGLTNVGQPVGGVVNDLSDGLKKRQDGAVPELLQSLAGEGGSVPNLLESLLGSGAAKEKRQLLADLSPDVVQLLSNLGLANVGVPVGGVVNDLSDGLKKRQDGAVPELLSNLLGNGGSVPELLESLLGSGVPAVPAAEKRQLLSDVSPDVTALLAGLGLGSVGGPVGGILDSASDGLKRRQLLADLSPDVEQLLANLGLANVGQPVGGVVNDLSDGL